MDELSRAVLGKLAEIRGPRDPLGELARAVLADETTLQQAARSAAYAEALHSATDQTRSGLSALTDQQRVDLDRAAELLRHADTEPRGEPPR